MEKEPTIKDVLTAVQAQDSRISDVLKEVRANEARTDQRIDDVLEAVNKGFSGVQEQFAAV